MTEKDLYERALRVWGKQPQMLQAIEEMSELTKEILKNVARGKDNLNELIEEAADFEIMLGQLNCWYGIERQVADYKSGKLKMIEQRLDEWEEKAKKEER